MENTALAEVASKTNFLTLSEGEFPEEGNWDVITIKEQITRLKGLMKIANKRSEKPLDVDGKQD